MGVSEVRALSSITFTPLSVSRRPVRRRLLATLAGVLAGVLAIPAAPVAAAVQPDDDPAVISTWNDIAARTLVADTGKLGPIPFFYMGVVHAAMYDAVNGVHRRYRPYLTKAHAPRGASAQAAAVAAAHQVLVTYSPAARATLDTAYAASLDGLPDGRSKAAGVQYGTRVADNLIAARVHDGRDAHVEFTQPPAPGVWRPTPPALAPMIGPEFALVTPLLLRSGSQFGDPGPPPSLTSAAYTRDFNEVKALGSLTSTERTTEQTATALFYSGNAIIQFNAALRDQVVIRRLDISEAARMFAAVDMSAADTFISVWYTKLKYGFWRPDTAITLADTDGNPATVADPAWRPMVPDPAYPEFVSGYSAQAGSFTRSLARSVGTRHLQATLISTAVPGASRGYDSGSALRADVVNGRMWLGVHFRSADEVGSRMGQRIGDWVLDHYFQPVGRH